MLLTEKYIEGPSDGHFVPAPACRADTEHSKAVKCVKTSISDKEEYRRSTSIGSALKRKYDQNYANVEDWFLAFKLLYPST